MYKEREVKERDVKHKIVCEGCMSISQLSCYNFQDSKATTRGKYLKVYTVYNVFLVLNHTCKSNYSVKYSMFM